MKKIICGWVAVLGLTLSACHVNVKPVDGNGILVEKEVNIDDYRVISVAGNAVQVQYVQADETPSLTVECDENLFSLMDIYTSNDSLYIEPKPEGLLMHPTKFVVRTGSSGIQAVNIAGDAAFEVSDSLVVPQLELNMAGKSRINAKALNVQQLELNLAGSCRSELGGKAERADLNIAGQCTYEAVALQTGTLTCKSAGSCSARVYVTDKIDLSPVGVFNLSYKGDPQIVQKGVNAGTMERIAE